MILDDLYQLALEENNRRFKMKLVKILKILER